MKPPPMLQPLYEDMRQDKNIFPGASLVSVTLEESLEAIRFAKKMNLSSLDDAY